MPTYPNRGLRTHAYDMHVWDCSKTPNLETRNIKTEQKQKP